jgi:putative serine protease PepD
MSRRSGAAASTATLSRRRLVGFAVGGLALAVLAGAGGAAAVLASQPAPGTCDTVALSASVLPSVVTVFATGSASSGSGSGSIISADGLVLTNDHVIADAVGSGTIEVLLNDGDLLPATLVGTDPITDLALLRVDRTRLPVLALARQDVLVVGQLVVALGAPLGLSGTVTRGIVSALNRNIPVPKAGGGTTVLAGAIQTDAAINPGNSGGPLVTCAGHLVGVNTAISTVPNANGVAGGGSVGIGFAVPAATAGRIVDELQRNGRATHPWIGAQTAEITQATAARFGVTAGLYVQEVTAGGPAATAGLQRGDVITSLAGSPATSVSLAWLLVSRQVGDSVAVAFTREGAAVDTTLVLAEQP